MVPSANSSHVSSSCMNTKHLRRHSLFLFPFCLPVFLPLIFEMYAFRVIFLVWYVYMYVFCRHFYQYSALQNKHFALPVELQQPVNDHFYTTSSQFLVTSYHFWEKGWRESSLSVAIKPKPLTLFIQPSPPTVWRNTFVFPSLLDFVRLLPEALIYPGNMFCCILCFVFHRLS